MNWLQWILISIGIAVVVGIVLVGAYYVIALSALS